MNLDIIARLVQILKEAPEMGAIEVRRGLFGFWSSVRVSKAGSVHGGPQHVMVSAPGPMSGMGGTGNRGPSAGAAPRPRAPGAAAAPGPAPPPAPPARPV